MSFDEDARAASTAVHAGGRYAAVAPIAGVRIPLGARQVALGDGELGAWQRRNRDATVPHSIEQLRLAGNLDNLARIADPGDGTSRFRGRYPFLDTDVFKTLEGLAYLLAEDEVVGAAPGDIRDFYEEAVGVIEAAQREDGYLNSYFQAPEIEKEPWEDLAWGHELYNLGHLIQAAIAAKRRLGDDRLLIVARAFADLAVERFGPDGNPQVCGHPEVEMALVELFRETGVPSYLELATAFVDRRGHGTVELRVFPAEYFQDSAPLRDLDSVTGHAVRMAYLAAGATDVALERGDQELLASLQRLWDDMVETKLYLTGGLGSRHSDEAIGDRYELPSERSYSETCAAIAVMQWGWRLYLATGSAAVLDTVETVLYNAYAAGLSADGMAFFYDNPLQRRPDHLQRSGAEADGELLRRSWFGCPCCPPNIVRWTAELQDHLATSTPAGVEVAHLTAASITTERLSVTVDTAYPWDGAVTVTVDTAADDEVELAIRIPAWVVGGSIRVGGSSAPLEPVDGWIRVRRWWRAGDTVELDLPMPVRAHGAHPSVDALRGSIAFARGPIVSCAEQQDTTADLDLLRFSGADADRAVVEHRRILDREEIDAVTLLVPATVDAPAPAVLYPILSGAPDAEPATAPLAEVATTASVTQTTATLIPYALWGNREPGAMRVWFRSH
ncbi:glycoside hydrolase family 127 protein [Plantibacter sp. PA-3-X8]|uniref:glycoside hydrolase family 127 protein n=1 Tax=Plantibacter sp. PA-3-X8 TaxID=2480625 RepID=UPI000F5F9E4E|nr:beta-L-arabinofuranosidase domain-containing protein [Plantibacter sp. PA-3-X8]AZH83023.1 glycoside hydrolase family 127 protein [Plantibacter sp. PA-3-X8]